MYQDPAVTVLLDLWTELLPKEFPPSAFFLKSLLHRPYTDVELCIRAIRSVAVALRTGEFDTGVTPPQLLSRRVNKLIISDRKRAEYVAQNGVERRPAPEVPELTTVNEDDWKPFPQATPEYEGDSWAPSGTKPLQRKAA